MPLGGRRIRPAEYYTDRTLFETAETERVLEAVAQTGLVGALGQLGVLASYATELFEDLVHEASATNDRVARLGTRVTTLVSTIARTDAEALGDDSKRECG